MTINMRSDCKFVRLRWVLFFVIIITSGLYFYNYATFLYPFLVRNAPFVDGHHEKVSYLKYFINLFLGFIPAILYCSIFLPKINIKTALKLFWIALLASFLSEFLGGCLDQYLFNIQYVILAAIIYLILTLKFNTPYVFIFVLIGSIIDGYGYKYNSCPLLLPQIAAFIFIIFYLFNITVGVGYILKHHRIQFKYLMILIIGIWLSVYRIYWASNLIK